MKITFYGTAAAEGVPALYCDCKVCEKARLLKGKDFRTRSQAMVNDDLLIDFPADTYMHVLNYGLPLHKIANIIITHSHSDHLYVVDVLMRAPGFSNMDNTRPLNIYGSSTVVKALRNNQGICDIAEKGYLNIRQLNVFETAIIDGYMVTPLKADHQNEAEAFIYLIEKDGKTILYAHDTGLFPVETIEYLKKSKPHIDFATFDCCFSLRHRESGQMGFDSVMVMHKRLEDIGVMDKNTVCCVNHFSHNNGELYEDMKEYASKYGYLTSYDGMKVEV